MRFALSHEIGADRERAKLPGRGKASPQIVAQICERGRSRARPWGRRVPWVSGQEYAQTRSRGNCTNATLGARWERLGLVGV